MSRPIVHLIPGLKSGGAENFLLKLLSTSEALRSRSAIVSVRPQVDLLERFEALGVPVTVLPISAGLGTVASLLRIAQALRQPEVRVIQSWLYLGDALSALGRPFGRGARRKIFWNIRSTHLGRESRATRQLAQRLNPVLSRFVPDAIICCSEEAASVHAGAGYRSDILRVITNGVDCASAATPDQRARARERLGIAPDDCVIGMVSRVSPYKDHDTLFAAVSALRGRHPRLRLILCGNGTEAANEALSAALSRSGIEDITLRLGLVGDMLPVYAALDLHVLSSRTEGFPNVVIEASMGGAASFATDVGAVRGIIRDPFFILPTGDVHEMTRRLDQYLSLPAPAQEQMRSSAREDIRARFDIDRVAGQYLEAYAPAL
ncbi:MAG TPA: glycosyltransferase [Burkholderiaceae bacterium]|nr:glycosyltransferase [Burkholderiaceae bacterium]